MSRPRATKHEALSLCKSNKLQTTCTKLNSLVIGDPCLLETFLSKLWSARNNDLLFICLFRQIIVNLIQQMICGWDLVVRNFFFRIDVHEKIEHVQIMKEHGIEVVVKLWRAGLLDYCAVMYGERSIISIITIPCLWQSQGGESTNKPNIMAMLMMECLYTTHFKDVQIL